MVLKYLPVKYVIFDMDGLLLDTESICFHTFTDVLKKYNVTYTNEVKVKVMGSVAKQTTQMLIDEYHLKVDFNQFLQEIQSTLKINSKNTKLMPGADRLIRHLKKNKVPIAVATSSSVDELEIKAKPHQELFNLFDHIVTGGSDPEVKHGKPAPDVFLVCASRFPEKPHSRDILVFEDSPNGVAGAKAAGMQVVMVPDVVIPEEKRKLATSVIDSLEDFKPEEFGLPKFDI